MKAIVTNIEEAMTAQLSTQPIGGLYPSLPIGIMTFDILTDGDTRSKLTQESLEFLLSFIDTSLGQPDKAKPLQDTFNKYSKRYRLIGISRILPTDMEEMDEDDLEATDLMHPKLELIVIMVTFRNKTVMVENGELKVVKTKHKADFEEYIKKCRKSKEE